MNIKTTILFFVFVLIGMPGAMAQVDYNSQVQPIFNASCAIPGCHTGASPSAGIDLTNFSHTIADTFGGALIVQPFNANASILFDSVAGIPVTGGLPMPLTGSPLTSAEINTIGMWINEGANASAPPVATSSINLTKTPSQTQVTSGTSVTYTYVVTNTGETTLSNVSVTDNILGSIGGPISLAAGANQTFTKSQVITANTTNTGTAKGTPPSGADVTSSATATVTVIPQGQPAINLTKTPSQTQVKSGTTVTYTYVVTNTGGTSLSNVTVTDNILGNIGGPITLNAGDSQTFTKSQVISADTTNTGTATGTSGTTTVTATATATVTIIQQGQNATVTFDVDDSNTGNKVVHALVSMDGVDVFTDHNGKAVFTDVSLGSHSFDVSKQPYNEFTGTVDVTGNQVVNVDLEKKHGRDT